MENEFRSFLNSKYGIEITNNVFIDKRISTENIKPANDLDQLLVTRHLSELKSKLNLEFEVSATPWAFDFSGWYGELDFGQERLKKYLVVGMEPHIEKYDFQITYGLSELTPNNEKRFSIDTNKKVVVCKDDSSVMWTNLFKIFSGEKLFSAVMEKGDEESLKQFLNQFYIADLCHFAPKGKANEVEKIKSWSKVRSFVASEFLKKEIELVNPELIITQGAVAFNKICEITDIKIINPFTISVGTQNWRIRYGNNERTKVLSLPHIGSRMINRTFWNRNLQKVKSTLEDNGIV
jgi:hypothetical protein